MDHKAFVSSTFEDLKAHRAAVIGALRKAGIQVDPMEDWTAASDEPKTFSQERIEGCDLCVLLVAFRRGHIPEGEVLSITQLEYHAARRLGMEVLVFMLAENAPWSRGFDELDKDPEIRTWRAELKEHHGIGFFSLAPDSIEIAPALTRWVTERLRSATSVTRERQRQAKLQDNFSPKVATFHYLSSRRIANLYEQLPDAAFSDDTPTALAWSRDARLDTDGDLGSLEERLRTYQRQLSVILNFWQRTTPPQPLAEVLAAAATPDPNTYYTCVADFRVETGNVLDRALLLSAALDGFTLKVLGSKENFPGLSPTGADRRYEPNSLMPGFFAGHGRLRLLAYVQCERFDRDALEIAAGALCLVSNPPEGGSKEPS